MRTRIQFSLQGGREIPALGRVCDHVTNAYCQRNLTANSSFATGIKRSAAAFSMLEIMIVIGILFILAGMGMTLISVTSSMSYRANCASNLRTIWQLVKLYKSNEGCVPPQYPTTRFQDVFADFEQDPRTFRCLAYDEGDEELADDTYSPFYVAPQNSAREVLLCLSPYHDDSETSVVITSYGRVNGARNRPIYYDGSELDPLAQVRGGTLVIGVNEGLIGLGSSVMLQLIASYEGETRNHLALKVLNSSTGSLDVRLPTRLKLLLISEAGIALMYADTGLGKFNVRLYTGSGTYYCEVVISSGTALGYGTGVIVRNR